MRVTTQQTYVSMTQSFNNLSGDLAHVVEQMATGKEILQPSDDPIAATRITQLNRQQSAIEQYQSNIDSASAGLSQQESILDGVNNSLLAVRDDLQAMQDEYDELGQQMSDMLQNTTYGGTNLFGVSGTSNTGTDGLFQSAVTFQVGAESSDTMTVNISSQLNTLVTDLSAISNSFSADQADTTGTAGVSGGTELTASGSANQMITSISTAMDDVSQIQSKLGASINRLNDTANNLTSMQDNTEVAIGNIMDTDYATEASNMTKQQVLMQTGITMLKQSNSMSSMVSSLLQ
ncbi:lateral flagellin LafA [Escherichia coli]|uniref:lateral flagellin LafA n=1 Tax=Escherichia coli TaxID=562 RepID=UPI000930B3E5|nr:lateral flagellin LafA [Escherichia coli]